MIKLERLLDAIVRAKLQHSDSSLRNPSNRDSFEYGRVTGIYQGLCSVEVMINDILKEDENNERRKV